MCCCQSSARNARKRIELLHCGRNIAMTGAMLASTVVWYLTAFFWIGDPQVPNLEEDPLL